MALAMISVWESVIATARLRKQIAMPVLPVPSDHTGGDCRKNERYNLSENHNSL